MLNMLLNDAQVVVVHPWMVKEIGAGPAIWFAQLLWTMKTERTEVVVRGDGSWEEETGLDRKQVFHARTKLVEHGWITCELRKHEGSPTSHVRLCPDRLEADLWTIHCPKMDKPGLSKNGQTSISLEVRENNASVCPPTPSPTPDRFDDFWAAYPKRTDKIAAKVAWAKAIKLADPQVIIDAARRYRPPDPRYTKIPPTWLNHGCWEDEVSGAQTQLSEWGYISQ